jgi:hypothetical protein
MFKEREKRWFLRPLLHIMECVEVSVTSAKQAISVHKIAVASDELERS